MIYLGVVLAAVWILWGVLEGVVYGVSYVGRRVKGTKHEQSEGKGVKQPQTGSSVPGWNRSLCRAYRKYSLFLIWVVGIVCLIMTLNCFLLYQVPTITERKLFITQEARKHTYGIAELTELRDEVVEKANALALRMERDEKGYIVSDLDIEETARQEMMRLGETYPQLSGYYPKPKRLKTSAFFSQQYIMGYYFPFSMEANYNTMIYITNQPATLCHELSHLKGFMREDEANFIGYLACISSEKEAFRYSGYLTGWVYAGNALARVDRKRYIELTNQLCREARQDLDENSDFWNRYESKVSEAATQMNDTYLKMNSQTDGVKSYGRMVDLMLSYRRMQQQEPER